MPKSKRNGGDTAATPFAAALSANAAKMATLHSDERPLWQGPCGAGWNGGVTQSMLCRFLSCRERFRLRYVVGLEPYDKWNHKMGYGNMWHVCEESLASHLAASPSVRGDWESALEEYTQQQLQAYPLQRDDISKWFNVCRVQFPEYVAYWKTHPDVQNRTPLLQEQVFDAPYLLPSGRTVRLRGKWDSVDLVEAHTDDQGRQWPSGVWLQENKTKGDIDRAQVERQLHFDLQTMMYLVALTELRAVTNTGEAEDPLPENCCTAPVLGARYNVVRRPLSGGKGNIVRHKATKNKEAETAEAFYQRLRDDYIAKDPAYWFFRVRAEISARDIEVFRRTCLDPLLETLCCWYDDVTGAWSRSGAYHCPPMNYRTPFGIFNALTEGGSTEYDYYLASGSEVGLMRVENLFEELR